MSLRGALDLSLYLVTDTALCAARGVPATVAAAVAAGVTLVQLRDPDATDDELVRLGRAVRAALEGTGVPLVVDDRVHLVAAIGADGAHVGQHDLPAVEARRLLGPTALLGLSVETPAQVAAARALPLGTLDYLGAGPVWAQTTKPDAAAPAGLDGLAAMVAASPWPVVAIGGIDAARARAVRATGAAGVAVVSAVCGRPDPALAVRALARSWHGAPPVALSIAGSDPSGGAGVQGDLKTFSALGAYGTAVLTALTAQSTQGVTGVRAVPAAFVDQQLRTLVADVPVDAVKIGMLATAPIAQAVGRFLHDERPAVVVLDPVMIATSGDRLLADDAVAAVRDLMPLASLVTPNLPEAACLLGAPEARTVAQLREQASALLAAGAQRVLLKGGHLDGDPVDVYADADGVVELTGERVPTRHTHGTGCALSSAVAALRPVRADWITTVTEAKQWLTGALRAADPLQIGAGHGPVHHLHALWAPVAETDRRRAPGAGPLSGASGTRG